MHAKTDSDVTSLPGSSPSRSRTGPVYYVQSPSRESTSQTHSSPALSHVGSPPRSHSTSSTRFSGSAHNNKANRTGNGSKRGGTGGTGGRHYQHPFDVIEEESLLGNYGEVERSRNISRRCYFFGFVVAFVFLFSFFSLVLWGASHNQKPVIAMKSIKFEEFGIQAGLDFHGVPTAMASLNATVKLAYRNRGTFFGIHVSSTPLLLSYHDLVIASGTMNYFYQRRKSRRDVTIKLMGSEVPLYGEGFTLSSKKGAPTSPVPLTLVFRVRSRAYVLGKLVKPKFYKTIRCSMVMAPKKMNLPLSLKSNCTYH